MLSKSHPIVLFIDRLGFDLYQDTLVNVSKFNFTPDLVSDLDVINKEQFVNLIGTFIQVNKIVPSSLVIILSDNIICIKDLVNSVQKPVPDQSLKVETNSDKEHKDEVQNFLENIPFEEILARVIKSGSVDRIVAVNKDLVMTIADTFVGKGSVMETIVPSFMYGQSTDFTAGLNLNNAQIILGNIETLRLGNLLTDQEKIDPSQNLENELKNSLSSVKSNSTKISKKKKNMRQYMLIGVFGVLLIVLVIVYLISSSQKLPKSYTIKVPKTTPVVAPTEIPVSASASATITPVIDLKTINVKISHSASSSGIITNLKTDLLKIGLQNVVDEISEVSLPEKSSIIFSQNISVDLRNNIIVEIKKILPDISILENPDSNNEIKISVGKS
jgi:hypothetical protein